MFDRASFQVAVSVRRGKQGWCPATWAFTWSRACTGCWCLPPSNFSVNLAAPPSRRCETVWGKHNILVCVGPMRCHVGNDCWSKKRCCGANIIVAWRKRVGSCRVYGLGGIFLRLVSLVCQFVTCGSLGSLPIADAFRTSLLCKILEFTNSKVALAISRRESDEVCLSEWLPWRRPCFPPPSRPVTPGRLPYRRRCARQET